MHTYTLISTRAHTRTHALIHALKYTHAQKHTHIHTHTDTFPHPRTLTHSHTQAHMHLLVAYVRPTHGSTHTHTHTRARARTHTYHIFTLTPAHLHLDICTCAPVHAHTFTHISCTYTHSRIHKLTQTCARKRVHTRVHTHKYTHTFAHAQKHIRTPTYTNILRISGQRRFFSFCKGKSFSRSPHRCVCVPIREKTRFNSNAGFHRNFEDWIIYYKNIFCRHHNRGLLNIQHCVFCK